MIWFFGKRKLFSEVKKHFLVPQNKSSEANKIYTNISNRQKFELLGFVCLPKIVIKLEIAAKFFAKSSMFDAFF